MLTLDMIKLELAIKDTEQDELLDLKMAEACEKIANYLNCTIEEAESYKQAVKVYCVRAYRNVGKENIQSETQGKRSKTYAGLGSGKLSNDVKALLPTPFLRCL